MIRLSIFLLIVLIAWIIGCASIVYHDIINKRSDIRAYLGEMIDKPLFGIINILVFFCILNFIYRILVVLLLVTILVLTRIVICLVLYGEVRVGDEETSYEISLGNLVKLICDRIYRLVFLIIYTIIKRMVDGGVIKIDVLRVVLGYVMGVPVWLVYIGSRFSIILYKTIKSGGSFIRLYDNLIINSKNMILIITSSYSDSVSELRLYMDGYKIRHNPGKGDKKIVDTMFKTIKIGGRVSHAGVQFPDKSTVTLSKNPLNSNDAYRWMGIKQPSYIQSNIIQHPKNVIEDLGNLTTVAEYAGFYNPFVREILNIKSSIIRISNTDGVIYVDENFNIIRLDGMYYEHKLIFDIRNGVVDYIMEMNKMYREIGLQLRNNKTIKVCEKSIKEFEEVSGVYKGDDGEHFMIKINNNKQVSVIKPEIEKKIIRSDLDLKHIILENAENIIEKKSILISPSWDDVIASYFDPI